MDTPTPHNRWLSLTSPPTSPAPIPAPGSWAEVPPLPQSQLSLALLTKMSPSAVPSTLNSAMSPLTPPITPEKQVDKRTSIGSDTIDTLMTPLCSQPKNVLSLDGASDDKEDDTEQTALKQVPEEPQTYHQKYRLVEELGHGVWSNVYRAFEQTEQPSTAAMFPPSPPISPESKRKGHQTQVLAVKVPSRRDAQKILQKEARVLTYLHSQTNASSYLVPFHGFDAATNSIVMTAIPTNLEAYVKAHPRAPLSTKTMFDPILGVETWSHLASTLIDGLAFLHSKSCIHGDIKPANILLIPDQTLPKTLTALYCDFSSSHILSPHTTNNNVEEISAITADYTSPELLTSFYHRNGDRAVATLASDVFALAVTLLFAATGESPYADAPIEMMKLSMAKEGAPLEFARRGGQGSRIMEGRAVARVLNPAVVKEVRGRVGVEEWREVARSVMEGWREGGWANGG